MDHWFVSLDQIALPDLEPMAMENWGLITYQEGVLLYEEGMSSLLHKEDIIFTIAHELAHQVTKINHLLPEMKNETSDKVDRITNLMLQYKNN